MKYSTWNTVDLHIHSIYSNKVKGNSDYVGKEYTARELLETLQKNQVSIFSVTDHNSINVDLYNDLFDLIQEDEFKKMSFLIGTELDVIDKNINNNVSFHCLAFFDIKDVDLAKKVIDEIFKDLPLSERTNKSNYPSISDLFNSFASNQIKDVLLIPHFNNKSGGIKSHEAVNHLNYLCFNGYEDVNNIVKITESLNRYLSAGYDNFPFAVFSDCHNLEVYPNQKEKNDNNPMKCSMLTDINYPFNSIKTAFEEPRMRISIDGVDKMRSIKTDHLYISEILINDTKIKLSPYQNTIIGKFGSGKSLLMEKIKIGQKGLYNHAEYKGLYNDHDSFKLIVDGSSSDTLPEIITKHKNIVNYDGLQYEDYYFKNELKYTQIKKLLERLNIKFNFKANFKTVLLKDTISASARKLKAEMGRSDIINSFNYEKAFIEDDYFNFVLSPFVENDYSTIMENIEDTLLNVENLESENLNNNNIFNSSEKEIIQQFVDLLIQKQQLINNLKDFSFDEKIHNILSEYKDEYIDNHAQESKDEVVSNLDNLNNDIITFSDDINNFEKVYNEDIFKSIFDKKKYKINDNLSIEYYFDGTNKNYEPLIQKSFAAGERKRNFFNSWVNAIYYNKKLYGNKSLKEIDDIISKYILDQNKLQELENTSYDIYYKEESVLNKSPGEKSSKFIQIIFELIEVDLKAGKTVLLTLDQPEDNIDNDNTFTLIANRIKELKLEYPNFQIIVVTHNANVGISADSENIIIAQDSIVDGVKNFEYLSGSIENRKHIDKACHILEGGITALRNRSIKYGLNIIRKVDKDEA